MLIEFPKLNVNIILIINFLKEKNNDLLTCNRCLVCSTNSRRDSISVFVKPNLSGLLSTTCI